MRAILAVMRRETQGYFVSPIAYVFIAVFLVLCGLGFYYKLLQYSSVPVAALAQQRSVSLRTAVIAGPLGLTAWVYLASLLSLPGLSMRLFSEERKVGTIELLFTSPVTTAQLVVGKYLSTLAVFAILLVFTVPYVGILIWKGKPEMGALGVAYLGFFLFGAWMLAVGLFASSLTENQFVALVLAYLFIVPFLAVEFVVGFAGSFLDPILAGLSVGVGMRRMSLGLVDTHYVFLFVALIFAFLFLCVRVLDSGKWR